MKIQILQALGAKFADTYDPVRIVMGRKQESISIEFDKSIQDLADMDANIELIQNLRRHSQRIHEDISHLADTLTNIHYSDEERRSMSDEELVRLSRADVEGEDDIFLYTT